MLRFSVSLVAALFAASTTAAQPATDATVDTPVVRAVYTTERPRIDGVLDEPFWRTIDPVSTFKQRLPNEGAEPSERTEVRIAFDEQFLYFGVTLFDSEPHKIVRNILKREGKFNEDDRFVLGLDTFLDHRNAYLFDCNPLGAQGDALVTDEGKPDWNWEAVYWTEARVTPIGWVVEIAIPFTTLRYPEAPQLDMGIAFYRQIRRKNEEDMWPLIGLNYRQQISQVSQYARLTGLRNIPRHHNLEIKPYGLVGVQSASPDGLAMHDAGLDVKYGVTSNLTLDLTYNTDFAQVEADELQVNLTRFSLFLPEKREFFLERAGLFAFGTSSEAMTFFSRRIGLAQDILAGARFTGHPGRWSIGLLDIVTRGDDVAPATNYAVARIRADLSRRATVGAIVTNADQGGTYDSATGADLAVRFWTSSQLTGWITKEWTPTHAPSSVGGNANLLLQSDTYNFALDYLNIGRNFSPAVGFVRRRDMIRYRVEAGYSPRIGRGDRPIRQLYFDGSETYIEGQDHEKQSTTTFGEAGVRFESGEDIGGSITQEFDRVPDAFDVVPGVSIHAGDYHFTEARAWVKTNTGRRLSGGLTFWRGGFYGRDRVGFNVNGLFKMSKHLSMSTTVERNTLSPSLEHGRFVTTLVRTSLFTAANRALFANWLIQYDSVTRQFQGQVRADWIHTPGSDLFVVFNIERVPNALAGQDLNARALVAKLTYLWTF